MKFVLKDAKTYERTAYPYPYKNFLDLPGMDEARRTNYLDVFIHDVSIGRFIQRSPQIIEISEAIHRAMERVVLRNEDPSDRSIRPARRSAGRWPSGKVEAMERKVAALGMQPATTDKFAFVRRLAAWVRGLSSGAASAGRGSCSSFRRLSTSRPSSSIRCSRPFG